MWRSSHLPDMYSSLPHPEDCSWIHNDEGSYHIDWEAPIRRVVKLTTVDVRKNLIIVDLDVSVRDVPIYQQLIIQVLIATTN